jgi:hypothetical protein
MKSDVFLAEFERSALNYLGTEDFNEDKYMRDSIAEAFIKNDSKTVHEMKMILGEIRRETEDEILGIRRLWGYETFLSHYSLLKVRSKAKEKKSN